LLTAGADVNATNIDGWTALMRVAHWGHIEILDMLLKAGADSNAVDSSGKTALMHTNDPVFKNILKVAMRNNIATEIINKTSLPLDILGEIFEFYDVDSKILKDARNREYGASK
jgi:hypothetical protein